MFDPTDQVQRRFYGYEPARLANALDDEVRGYLQTLNARGSDAFVEAERSVADVARDVLCAYAVRMASLSVRRREPSLLDLAVVAAVLGGLNQGEYESLMALAPIEDAARRLQFELPGLFGRVGRTVGDEGMASLGRWLARAPEDRTLACMRYKAAADHDGFVYLSD